MSHIEYVRWLERLGSEDVSEVGGKNASLGEMISSLKEEGVQVPGGFATTAEAYWHYLDTNNLKDSIDGILEEYRNDKKDLEEAGKQIRDRIRDGKFSDSLRESIENAYDELCRRHEAEEIDVAVRSSATAEDLPEASFAGQQETFLNIRGEGELLDACRKCFASLFTDRAISYREEQGFDHMDVALSVGVQKMVRSDKAGAGVMFTLDTETGFRDVVVIDAAWGLGENVVQGTVNPDEYVVFKKKLGEAPSPIIQKELGTKEKTIVYASGGSATTKNLDTPRKRRESFVLSDGEILTLAEWAAKIERHYEKPMDIEWAKDGLSGELFIVQARPETVQSQKETSSLKTYQLEEKEEVLSQGLSIGQAIAAGRSRLISDLDEMDRFEDGDILVTEMTDPDWLPIMKRASAVVTDHGGRTSHAAIVSRELGIPAIVGCEDATDQLEDGDEVTVSCAEGDRGFVYKGILDFDESTINLEELPETATRIMMNMASPPAAFRWWRLPATGIGLARMEFILNNIIKVHPLALTRFDEVEDLETREEIEQLTSGFESKEEYFLSTLSRGISSIAVSQYPEPVVVRMSDFKTNEYADLIGGEFFEPEEENPMLGFRGASRYYSDRYRDGFALECRAIRRAREEIGLDNIIIMIPFCRSLDEADRVLEVLEENGLKRGEKGLEIYMMCEIPANLLLAPQFARRFDGFSIGTNDLTQLVLGVDRDSEELSDLFDERNEAVKMAVADVIEKAHEAGIKVGLCGQAPSDHPDYAAFLVESGIDSISVSPDSVVAVLQTVAEAESS